MSAPVARHANELQNTTFQVLAFAHERQEIVQLKPTPHEDYIIDPDDFPSDPDAAHCLGVLMAMSRPDVMIVIRPLAYGSTSATLTVYARRGWPAWRVAGVDGTAGSAR